MVLALRICTFPVSLLVVLLPVVVKLSAAWVGRAGSLSSVCFNRSMWLTGNTSLTSLLLMCKNDISNGAISGAGINNYVAPSSMVGLRLIGHSLGSLRNSARTYCA